MEEVSIIGIDLAKRTCQVHGAKSDADSDSCRSPIPTHADHGFRCMPITLE